MFLSITRLKTARKSQSSDVIESKLPVKPCAEGRDSLKRRDISRGADYQNLEKERKANPS
jgi:hypothetical protein